MSIPTDLSGVSPAASSAAPASPAGSQGLQATEASPSYATSGDTDDDGLNDNKPVPYKRFKQSREQMAQLREEHKATVAKNAALEQRLQELMGFTQKLQEAVSSRETEWDRMRTGIAGAFGLQGEADPYAPPPDPVAEKLDAVTKQLEAVQKRLEETDGKWSQKEADRENAVRARQIQGQLEKAFTNAKLPPEAMRMATFNAVAQMENWVQRYPDVPFPKLFQAAVKQVVEQFQGYEAKVKDRYQPKPRAPIQSHAQRAPNGFSPKNIKDATRHLLEMAEKEGIDVTGM